MGYAAKHFDELGEGYGFRKVRTALGIEAFGANVIVAPGGFGSWFHYHDKQDELYFIHSGRATFDVDGEPVEVGPGSLLHVEAATPRRFDVVGDEDLVMLVIGGHGGYVGRDGKMVNEEDIEARAAAFSNNPPPKSQ